MSARLYPTFQTPTMPIIKEIPIDEVPNIWGTNGKENILVEGEKRNYRTIAANKKSLQDQLP